MSENNTLTPEQIARQYSATMDSVTVVNRLKDVKPLNQDNIDEIDRNVEHLKIMIAKDFWTVEDLTPFNTAIAKGTAAIEAAKNPEAAA